MMKEFKQSPADMTQPWVRLMADDKESVARLESMLGISLEFNGHAVRERGDFILFPVEQVERTETSYRETPLFVVLGSNVLITFEQSRFQCLDGLFSQVMAAPKEAPAEILLKLLVTLNDASRTTIRNISAQLDDYADTVLKANGGFDTDGRQVGIANIAGTAVALSEAEELVAKTIDNEQALGRAGRALRRWVVAPELLQNIEMYIADVTSLRRFAFYQHEKIKTLEESMMTTLDLKQNQITKVFTVVTAVFTPPTLVGAFYGQNFSYMPELSLPEAEWWVILMTAIAAIVPMFYIMRKGWMR